MKIKNFTTRLGFTIRLTFAFALTLIATPILHGQFGGQFTPPISPTAKPANSSGAATFNPTPFKVTSPSSVKPKQFGSPESFAAPKNLKAPPSFNNQATTRQAKATFGPGTLAKPNKPATALPTTPQSPFSRPEAQTGSQEKSTQFPLTPAKSTSYPNTNPRGSSFGGSMPRPQITSGESSRSSTLPDKVECIGSSVSFIDDIKLPAKEAGDISKLYFKEGDFVPANKVIAQINDEVAQMLLEEADLNLSIAEAKWKNTTASLAARKKWNVAKIEAKRTARLALNGSKSESEKMMANYTQEIAYLELKKAEEDRRIALVEAKRAKAQKRQVQTRIARHTIDSNFDGYIVEIKKKEQEYVQTGEEVVRLARMDRVYVQSVVSFRDLNAHELLNRKVTITVPLARDEETTFEGQVKFVGLERKTAELLMVKAEVINRPVNGHWVLHPEAEVKMTIHLGDPPSNFGSASNGKFTR